MGICLGKTTTSPRWLELSPEIAGEILSRLPTHEDRLNFKTVFRGWHLVAGQQGRLLPPAVPCIDLGHGVYQSIITHNNGIKVRRHLFATPTGFRVRATFGSWVLYEHRRSRRCFLRDPFSPSTPAMEVPCRYRRECHPSNILLHDRVLYGVEKIIVCSSRLVIALTRYTVLVDSSAADASCFLPETTDELWSRDFLFEDIAFHRGKIFIVNSAEHLFSHWLVPEVQSQSPTSPREHISSHYRFFEQGPPHSQAEDVINEGPAIVVAAARNHYHVLTSSDKQKLLMVRWSISHRMNDIEADNREMNLHVFEADLDNGRWLEVKDLGSQVLFVGRTGSRAFLVEGSTEHYYGRQFRGGNRVFILGHDWALAHERANTASSRCPHCQKLAADIPSYCVYDMVTGETSLVSLNGGHGSAKSSKAQWFFPSE
jgi:hypothetical protein